MVALHLFFNPGSTIISENSYMFGSKGFSSPKISSYIYIYIDPLTFYHLSFLGFTFGASHLHKNQRPLPPSHDLEPHLPAREDRFRGGKGEGVGARLSGTATAGMPRRFFLTLLGWVI